jgi:L-threonylcarbamoyladenylate synthase
VSEEPNEVETVVVDDSDESLVRAAGLLRTGQLVAVPTETVYGLAGDAANPDAVARIFAAKGRPADHPLIVHLGDTDQLATWAVDVPLAADRLVDRWWPGPLTLVLHRHPDVPVGVTGGLDTVAVRMPAHPVARRLLAAFGGALAAPSANPFGKVSPTSAADVVAGLGGRVPLVIDAGPCRVGVESTVLDLSGDTPTILRPGAVTAHDVEGVLGVPVAVSDDPDVAGRVRAPGMLVSHYAPDTPVQWCEPTALDGRLRDHLAAGRRVGVLAAQGIEAPDGVWVRHASGDVDAYAHSLYRWLRDADEAGLDVLMVIPPDDIGMGTAVRDRLRRAAGE